MLYLWILFTSVLGLKSAHAVVNDWHNLPFHVENRSQHQLHLYPHQEPLTTKTSTPFPYSENEIAFFSKKWGKLAADQYKALKIEEQNLTDQCTKKPYHPLRAAYAFGRYEDIIHFAQKCPMDMDHRSFRVAALSAIQLAQHEAAENFFEMALKGAKFADSDEEATLLLWSAWLMDKNKLDLNPNWSAQDKKIRFSMILLSNGHALPDQTAMQDYLIFFKSEIERPEATLFYKNIILLFELKRMFYKQDTAAFALLDHHVADFEDPSSWSRLAFRTLFATPAPMFRHSSNFYEQIIPFLHVRSPLPVEDNPYNYTEIYSQICKKQLSQGTARTEFFAAKESWRSGKISNLDFERKINLINQKNPDKADILTALASIAYMKNQRETARDLAWKAHRKCPYYNRASWILMSLNKEDLLRNERDYATLDHQKDIENQKYKVPNEISKYIINWQHIPDHDKDDLVWSIRGWLDYIPSLVQTQRTAYIKFPFELMSELPGLSEMKDTRVHYERDNRLWDDVRGMGGSMIVSDFFESPLAPFGAYNLLEHEMAHQMDDYFQEKIPTVRQCIDDLFKNAKTKNIFATGYARTRFEYFAVASESFFIPDNYPLRFGLKKEWYQKNDAGIYGLFNDILGEPESAYRHQCKPQ